MPARGRMVGRRRVGGPHETERSASPPDHARRCGRSRGSGRDRRHPAPVDTVGIVARDIDDLGQQPSAKVVGSNPSTRGTGRSRPRSFSAASLRGLGSRKSDLCAGQTRDHFSKGRGRSASGHLIEDPDPLAALGRILERASSIQRTRSRIWMKARPDRRSRARSRDSRSPPGSEIG